MKGRYLFILLTIRCLLCCVGFDFTLDSETSDDALNSHVCGVLHCSDKLSDPTNAHHTQKSRVLNSFAISRNRLHKETKKNEQWQLLASLTPEKPTLDQVSNGVKVKGQISKWLASLSLEFNNTTDCAQSQFLCTAIFVDGQGRESIKTSVLGTAVEDLAQVTIDPMQPRGASSETGDLLSLSANLMQMAGSVYGIGSRLDDLVNSLENRLEDKVEELRAVVTDRSARLDKSMEDRLTLIDTRLDTLENRLEDRMTQLHNRMLHNFRQAETSCVDNAGICGQVASKLDDLSEKVDTNSHKLDTCVSIVKQQNESTLNAMVQLKATVDQCFSSEVTELTSLVSVVNGLSGLTHDLTTRVGSFTAGYGSGALVTVDQYFDALNTGKKEWRLVFRGTAHTNIQVYPAYIHGTGIPIEVEEGCRQFNSSLPCVNHYRNKDAFENWAGVDEVLFAIYKGGQMVKRVIFNGKGSTFTSWFAANRIIQSSWIDLTTQPHNYFSIFGADHDNHFRRFFMSLDYHNGCAGFRGWFKASDTLIGCPKEVKALAIPFFQYAPGSTFAIWESKAASADAFGVFLRYE